MAEGQRDGEEIPEQVTSEIFTAANVVSFVRLCLVPVYLWLLLSGFNLAATLVFAAAAASDFIDGQLARRTHTVSKLGQILDPAVDRILMITGVLGVFLVGRIPLWVIVVVVLRDAYLLIGGAWLLSRYRIRVPVVYPGKFATTFLFIGFAGLLFNAPLIPGLGWCDISWLPGFNGEAVSWGIWFIYAGLILSLGVTIYYTVAAARALAAELLRLRGEGVCGGAGPSFREIVELAGHGDGPAAAALDGFCNYVSYALVNCLNIVDTHQVFVGYRGDESGLLERLLESKVNSRLLAGECRRVRVERSRFLNRAPVFGAVALVARQVFRGELPVLAEG